MGTTRLLLLLAGLVVVGLAVAGRRLPRLYSATALMLLNTLVLLAALELAAAAILQVTKEPPAAEEPASDRASASSYYRNRDWARQYWSEFGARPRNRYRPYVLWRMAPYESRLIRVDEQGVRLTPGSICDAGAYTVFFFGGSTAWGLGSPDWGTIPAYLREELATVLRRPVCMRNFGELGWVSTQDLIQLERELQAERVPDLAIFYGGVNDVVMGYQHGEPGLHWELRKITERLERPDEDRGGGLSELRWQSNLYRLAVKVKTPAPPPVDSVVTHTSRAGFVADSVADQVAALYLTNYRLAAALGRDYGFGVEFFWQPNALVDPKPLTTEEDRYRRAENIAPLIERVTRRVQSTAPAHPHFHDLTRVFAGLADLVYLDWHHITPDGNRLVAQAMLDTLRRSGALRPPRGSATGR
ncbi:MAG: SGNH/GDSL hydrolase family protein [Gemmatimonadales bacterium]